MDSLAVAIADTAAALAPAHLQSLADAYRSAGGYSVQAASHAASAVPAPHRATVKALNAAWRAAPDTSGEAVAVALESVLASQSRTQRTDVSVVVTGPDSPAAPVRLTSQVVQQLIDNATSRVTIVSYSAYKVDSVIGALDRAVARGVKVQLVLESEENLRDGGGAHAYAKYEMFEWPMNKRPTGSSLHAKAVIVDGRDVLLTSANLSNAAYDKSIELGVLCRGGPTAAQVQRHFDALISTGVLRRSRP